MPEPIAERVHATAVAGPEDLACFVKIRDVGERLVAEAALGNGGGPSSRVDLAIEALGELQLLGVAEWLIPKDEHRVLIEPTADFVECFAVLNPTKVDRARLGDKERVKIFEVNRHHLSK